MRGRVQGATCFFWHKAVKQASRHQPCCVLCAVRWVLSALAWSQCRPRRAPALPHPVQVGEERVGAWRPQQVAHVGALQHLVHWGVQLRWRDCRTGGRGSGRWQGGGRNALAAEQPGAAVAGLLEYRMCMSPLRGGVMVGLASRLGMAACSCAYGPAQRVRPQRG